MDAVLGAEIIVPTIDGDVKFNISAGTQNGTVFNLKALPVANPRTLEGYTTYNASLKVIKSSARPSLVV